MTLGPSTLPRYQRVGGPVRSPHRLAATCQPTANGGRSGGVALLRQSRSALRRSSLGHGHGQAIGARMHGSAAWKTEETIVGLPRLLRFGGCHEWHSVKLNTLGFKVLRRKTPAHRLIVNNMISLSLDPKPSVSEAYSIFYISIDIDICRRRVDRNSLSHKMLLLIRVPFLPDTELSPLRVEGHRDRARAWPASRCAAP